MVEVKNLGHGGLDLDLEGDQFFYDINDFLALSGLVEISPRELLLADTLLCEVD